ncbi:MAG: metal ABC transporter permease [Candidatus Sungbacteria bacterium]|nr:metal ABC transporter permease [bacterium]MDZ4260570.1 metal ABC transporter permease [Candidatus Sungbacteria bacterium]
MISLLSFDTLVVALVIGAASGVIGSFILLRRMALVGDALSHVALPGIAFALAYEIDPFWGVLVFLLAAATLVWTLERTTGLYSEALVGLLFTLSLAIGILTIPDHEIIESLFGGFSALPQSVLIVVVGAGILLIIGTFLLTRRFLFSIISPDLASIEASHKSKWHELALLLIFSFVVALGIKLVGTLLMGALTIIPASISKNLSRSISGYIVISSFLGGGIALFGVIAADYFGFLPGPTVVILGICLFVGSLFFIRKT